jgi:hypothetical protein
LGFYNTVLRIIFGPKRDELIEEWRKLHPEKLHDLYSSSTIVRVTKIERNEMGGTCSSDGERRGVYRALVGKPEGKRPLGRRRSRWEDNNKIDLQEVGCRGMECIGLAQNRDRWRAIVNAVMNLWVP